jgi:hypothetical protein
VYNIIVGNQEEAHMSNIKPIYSTPAKDEKQAHAFAIDIAVKSKKAYDQYYNIFNSNSMQKRIACVQSAFYKLYANKHSTKYALTYRPNKNKPFVSIKVATPTVLQVEKACVRKIRQEFSNVLHANNATIRYSFNTNSLLVKVHS